MCGSLQYSRYGNIILSVYLYWIFNYSCLFQNSTGRELALNRLGYNTVIELLGTMPDVVAIERPTDRDWLLKAPSQQRKDNQDNIQREDCGGNVQNMHHRGTSETGDTRKTQKGRAGKLGSSLTDVVHC